MTRRSPAASRPGSVNSSVVVAGSFNSTHCWPKRGSRDGEQAEFVNGLRVLGIEARRVRGWQPFRCWNADGHANGDRHPSMQVSVEFCGYVCHACGIRGGLREIRALTGGRQRRSGTEMRSMPIGQLIAVLWALADPNTDLLSLLPPAAVAELRARTGRYRKDSTLRRALALYVTVLLTQFEHAGRTAGVRLTAADADAAGLHPRVWRELRDVVGLLGFVAIVGQSGRHVRPGEGFGKAGKLTATTWAITDCAYSKVKEAEGSITSTSGVCAMRQARALCQVEAVMATGAPAAEAGPSFHGRGTSAWVMADLLSEWTHVPATGRVEKLTGVSFTLISDLVVRHGPGVKRLLREMEADGLVERCMPYRCGAYLGVVPTDAGASAFYADAAAGRGLREERVSKQRQAWTDYQRRRLTDSQPAGPQPQVWPVEACWVSLGDGRVVHEQTGEIRTLAELREAA